MKPTSQNGIQPCTAAETHTGEQHSDWGFSLIREETEKIGAAVGKVAEMVVD